MSPPLCLTDCPHSPTPEFCSAMHVSLESSSAVAARLHSFAGASQIAFVTTDEAGIISSANDAAARIFRIITGSMIGRSIETIMPERFRAEHSAGMRRIRSGGTSKLAGKTIELIGLREDGHEFPIEISICSWRGSRGVEFGALIQDISERRIRERRLASLALHDSLTGLPNQAGFQAKLDAIQKVGGGTTLLLCDLRRLKEVNDTLGHDVGDALLQLVALRLLAHGTQESFVARYSDDAFTVLAEGAMTPDDLRRHIEDVVGTLAQPFEVGAHRLHVEVSIGCVSCSGQATEQIFSCADLALLQARKLPGGGYCIFVPAMASAVVARRLLNDQLRQATDGQEWLLHYQPQVSLIDGALIGLEALLRWNHPQRGLLGPAEFITVLERHFGAERVGLWILDEACRQLRAWRNIGLTVPKVAVNLFASQFGAKSLAADVFAALDRHGLYATDLELEITEKIALDAGGHGETCLRELAAQGVEISFDDFGTGFASLSSLKQFPVTRLKIDKSFVDDVAEGTSSSAIVKAIVSIGESLGVDVIAEGVETEAQRRQLIALGCRSGQGYLFGHPVPAHLVGVAVPSMTQLAAYKARSRLRMVLAPSMERGRDFADIVYTLLVVEKLKRVEQVADAIGMSYASFHARLINRTSFSADEIQAIIKEIGDTRLIDYFLDGSPFISVLRKGQASDDDTHSQPVSVDPMSVQREAVRLVVDATDVLEIVDAGVAGGRIDHRIARLAIRATGATERALATIRLTLTSLK